MSCSPTAKIPAALAPRAEVSIPFSITNISILDSRPDTATAEMKLPLVVTRQRDWTIKPGITDVQKQNAYMQVQNASMEGKLSAHAIIEILDGFYRIEGNSQRVSELTYFRCKIQIVDPATGNTWFSTAEASYSYQTINATEKHVKMLYEATIHKCVSIALQYLADASPSPSLQGGQ